jgi:hypothetical protein
MLNLFTESVLQKNFDTPSLFSIAQHRWVETGSNRQFSELHTIFCKIGGSYYSQSPGLYYNINHLGKVPSFVASRHV